MSLKPSQHTHFMCMCNSEQNRCESWIRLRNTFRLRLFPGFGFCPGRSLQFSWGSVGYLSLFVFGFSYRLNIARNNNKQLRKTKGNQKTEKTDAFLFFISCSVMTRHHEVGFRHNLQYFAPISLPDLSEPSRTSKNFRETISLETDNFRAPSKF